MFADPAILKQALKDKPKLDPQAYQNAARRRGSILLLSSSKEDALQSSLLEYAAFAVEQEDRYCQQ